MASQYGLGSDHLETVPISEVIDLLHKSSLHGEDAEQKEKIKADLAGKFDNLDKILDVIVKDNEHNFQESIATFINLYSDLQAADGLLERLATNVISCQEKIQLRRETFIQLWCSHVELEEVLRQLDLADDVRRAAEQIKLLCGAKQFYVAARLLTSTLHHLDTDLQRVGALHDYKALLMQIQTGLCDTLIEELHSHIYLKWKNNEATGPYIVDDREALFIKLTRPRGAAGKLSLTASLVEKLATQNLYTPKMEQYLKDCVDFGSESSTRYMASLLDALRVLGKLPIALEAIQQRLSRELSDAIRMVVENCIQENNIINNDAPRLGLHKETDNGTDRRAKILSPMLALLFERLEEVLSHYAFVLGEIQRAHETLDTVRPAEGAHVDEPMLVLDSSASSFKFSAIDVWAAIQQDVQNILDAYLKAPDSATIETYEMPTTKSHGNRLKSVTTLDKLDVANFFTPTHVQRERNLRTQKQLFSFAGSEYASTVETRRESVMMSQSSVPTFPMVCDRDPRLLTICYDPVRAFCERMNALCNAPIDEGGCALQQYINEFTSGPFLDYIRADAFARLKAACEDPDAFTVATGTIGIQSVGANNVLVKSVLLVESIQDDIQQVANRLPKLRDALMAIMVDILATYCEHCQETYEAAMERTFAAPDGTFGSALSMSWVADNTLSGLMQQYSAWLVVKIASDPLRQPPLTNDEAAARDKLLHDEQVQSELHLISQMPNGVRRRMLIRQWSAFTVLANMHQSLEWLGSKLSVSQDALRKRRSSISSPGPRRNSLMPLVDEDDAHLELLRLRYRELGQLADQCLLTLKMEARCQCYYYVAIFLQKSVFHLENEPLQADTNVVKLNEMLSRMEEYISPFLPPVKINFVFDRVDTLISRLVLHYVGEIETINALGVDKLCRNVFGLKQNFTNITLKPSKEFETALNYCELLYYSMKDIVDHEIKDKKPRYKLHEYLQLFEVLRRSAEDGGGGYAQQSERLWKYYELSVPGQVKLAVARTRAQTTVSRPAPPPPPAGSQDSGTAGRSRAHTTMAKGPGDPLPDIASF